METSKQVDEGGEMAARDLASIDEARRGFAGSLVVPKWYDLTSGTATGLNVAAVGLIFGGSPAWRVILGVALFAAAMAALGWSMRRFRDANGAWVSGSRKGRTFRTSAVGGGVQMILGFAAAMAAVAAGWWWLGLILAPVQVIVFVFVSRRWMRIYREEHGV